ncbi:RNA pyrophosphohydrolase [Pseudooceanicola sediminis]|uniref:RNA pyrophosphohydrolase n=1 Tax=Pseudooceanicola sediminis TaxID=2211117 RepID=A0A399J1B9_9RHOB|nr:RNA pyrophosphohydrolase [Pseudooceanicola sediminis]KAA2312898.1 RNA pyrophosphohydrolase [Puniceibacterium sp. HSS470]RII37702.1 RNA pyrophosphohydrolase [Pseudooceanicola sediminis]|tara:strand:- start:53262 stop:53744 length:483 start_codon:yes stop_codon:yes gene_type:complete
MTPQEIERLPYRPCVGVMLVNRDGAVFTGQRIDSEVAAWQMPQGGIDAGESPEEAGLRELWEETGITADKVMIEAETAEWVTYDLPPELAGRIWGGAFRGQKQKWLLMRFRGADDDVKIDTEHPEFSAWRWMTPDALVDNIVPFKREVYARVLAEFGERL